TNLRELYQEVILDHSKKPRNFREMADATRKSDGYNPLCGDKATVYVKLKGAGCSISTASASMMTDALKGKTTAEAEALFQRFHTLVTSDPSKASENAAPELGKLAVFSGVCEFPVRVKCAALAWHTLKAAMDNQVT